MDPPIMHGDIMNISAGNVYLRSVSVLRQEESYHDFFCVSNIAKSSHDRVDECNGVANDERSYACTLCAMMCGDTPYCFQDGYRYA